MQLLSLFRQTLDTIRLLPRGGPSCCNIAVTNVCNATCDFCGYAKDKMAGYESSDKDGVFVDLGEFVNRREIRTNEMPTPESFGRVFQRA